MLRIHCPCCGLRDHSEFEYGGDASVQYPPVGADGDAWFQAVYARRDVEGRHFEFWRHSLGCRSWLVVERDTRTHEIHSTRLAHPGAAAALAEG